MADDREIAMQFAAVWLSGAAANVINLGAMLGRELTQADLEPATWTMAQLGSDLSGVDVLQAQGAMHTFRRGMAEWWEDGWDLLLTPTTMQPAPRIGELTSTSEEPLRNAIRSIPYAAYTSMFNVTGQPAISLPLHHTAGGLPIGIQLVAAYGREDLLIEVAAQLEAEVNWAANRAPLHA
jgi:amidase